MENVCDVLVVEGWRTLGQTAEQTKWETNRSFSRKRAKEKMKGVKKLKKLEGVSENV